MIDYQIRQGVFETNSSSSHSLVIVQDGDFIESPFSEDVLQEGVYHVGSDDYGWGMEIYSSFDEKLTYLATIFLIDLPKL